MCKPDADWHCEHGIPHYADCNECARKVGLRDFPVYRKATLMPLATSRQTTMRRFVLVRQEDVSGTSGTGVVAEGIEFSNGQAVLHWLTQLESIAVYASMKVLDQVHGHNGKTKIEWMDEP